MKGIKLNDLIERVYVITKKAENNVNKRSAEAPGMNISDSDTSITKSNILVRVVFQEN